jgi:Tfp pilus assembly protein PilO
MNMQSIKLSNWWWVGYPLGVIVFIILSLGYLMNNASAIQNITAKQSDAEEQQKIAEQLRTKLESLKKVDSPVETERLKQFLVAVPASRRVWYLISELNKSASESGIVLKEYRGVVGDVKEASESAEMPTADDPTVKMSLKVQYDTLEFEPLSKALAILEGVLPLVKVTKVAYSSTGVEVTVEGAWGPWVKVSGDSGSPLPDYQGLSSKVEKELSGLQEIY